eukprot:CAMPEP_0175079256 /NCGR_PEP_ID=MMETSP0052_2-20121109/24712_1 /TAXON_ID=51329 ORGANISM="Polytomella parva, Strain SAG 63-3" /NCGR_SAMPLE_ID=MMETSP0052_2 /ASSEMBLY_ACC=CAM_ASM_000194 /LENGTH=491 /DNA_ID=CAMNT_0016349547 /DNA_START=225 /DNA_END=1700 /DNA_ORIENTATION=-
MTPIVRSERHPAWRRLPARNTLYYRSPQQTDTQYVLSFVFVFEHEDDVYEFAYSYPFTFTALQHELSYLEFLELPYLRRQELCRSLQQRRVDVLTISSPMTSCPLLNPGSLPAVSSDLSGRRRVVIITGRVHPGETPSSYVVQGLTNWLLSNDSGAEAARNAATWVIIPMLNPDGVFLGNYRSDSMGADLNRRWTTPHESVTPSLHHTLRLIQAYRLQSTFHVSLFIDIHAHTSSGQSFLLCNPPSPMLDVDRPRALERIARLPRLCQTHVPGFSLARSTFDQDAGKASCARRVVGAMVPDGISLAYTFEVSFFHCTTPGCATACGPNSVAHVPVTNGGMTTSGSGSGNSGNHNYGISGNNGNNNANSLSNGGLYPTSTGLSRTTASGALMRNGSGRGSSLRRDGSGSGIANGTLNAMIGYGGNNNNNNNSNSSSSSSSSNNNSNNSSSNINSSANSNALSAAANTIETYMDVGRGLGIAILEYLTTSPMR